MIVKNPDGEEYIVNPDKFAAKYKDTETPGVYQPIAEPIQYNPVLWTNKQKTKLNKKTHTLKVCVFC